MKHKFYSFLLCSLMLLVVGPGMAQTNTSHENAELIELDQEVTYSHASSPAAQTLYFKFNVEAGEIYEITGTYNDFYYSDLTVYDTTENSPVTTTCVSTNVMESYRLTVTKTGTLHIKRSIKYYTENPITMTVRQITDSRVCANAVEVNTGQEVSYNHKTDYELWWKVELDANSTYLINFNNENENGATLYIYNNCDEETALAESSYGIINVSTTTEGYYYIRSYTYNLYSEESNFNTFTISKFANDNNTSCSSAKQIAVNGDVFTSFSYGDLLWYKVDVEGGKVYELDGRGTDPYSWTVSVNVYASCEATTAIAGISQCPGVVYLAPEYDTTYYIRWRNGGNTSLDPFIWGFNEVTDNRTCQLASPITLNENITVPTVADGARDSYWYSLEVQAGNFYEIDFNEAYSTSWDKDEMLIYSDCSQRDFLSRFTKSKHLLAPESSGILYLKIERTAFSNSQLVWKVSQVSAGDNRLCAYAQNITLGADIQTDHTPGYIDLWYKVPLEGGKVYEIDASEASTNLYYYIGEEVCDTYLNSNILYIQRGTKNLIDPEVDVVYYFHTIDQSGTPSHNFTWKISETEGDNRLCSYATLINQGAAFTVDHTDNDTYWFKLNVTANGSYSVELPETLGEYVRVFDECGGEMKKSVHGEPFSFVAEHTGLYYLHFINRSSKPTFDCTVTEVIDNRSCLYPANVSIDQPVNANYVQGGLWYLIQLDANDIYEFDFTDSGLIGSIYTSCGENLPLAQGESEKMLFKPTTTGAYLVHTGTYYADNSMNWSFAKKESGDSRLCEYAVEVSVEDTTTTYFTDSHRTHWYKVEVQADKYYEIGSCDKESNALGINIYAGCEEQVALASVVGTKVLSAETDGTLYLKVVFSPHTNVTSAQWYIKEVTPDGRVCSLGLEASIGEEITTYNYHATAEFDMWGDGNDYPPYVTTQGTWYNLYIDEAGVYEIRLQDWDFYEELGEGGYYGPFYYAHVFTTCDLFSSYLGSAGHYFNTGRFSFEAEENTVFYILMEQYEPRPEPFTWEIVKIGESTAPKGIIGVSLANEEGDFINVSTANVRVYRKDNGTLLPAGIATWTDWKGISMYETNEISVGAYLIYVDGVPGYLAEWYNHAGVWEDATEVILTENNARVEIRPKAIPADISSGSVSISGSVFDAAAAQPGGSAAIEGVSISIYREKSSSQQSQAQRSKVFYRIVNPVVWELVATIKTDANGQYQINQLPQGRYKIIVDLPGFSTEDGGVVIDAVEGESYSNNNFEADTVTMTVSRQVTGLRGPALQNISLYPNPFDKELVIVHAEDCWLQVFNLEGVQVFTQQLTQTREAVRLDELPSGIYFFRLEKDGRTASFKAIKK